MASTEFTDFETRVVAEWLNDVNDHAYNEITANVHPASAISFAASGAIGSTNVQDAIEEVAASSGGGGGGGATTLNGLTDVDVTGAVTGQVLKFNGSTWAAAEDVASGGSGTDADTLDGFDGAYYLNYNNFTNKPVIPSVLGDLGNVSSTSPSAGQVLKWSGSQWAPAADESGGAASDQGKVLGVAYLAPSATEIVASTADPSWTQVGSQAYNKQSATSDIVVILNVRFEAQGTNPKSEQTRAWLGIGYNGSNIFKVNRANNSHSLDGGVTYYQKSIPAGGTRVITGLPAGSVSITAHATKVSSTGNATPGVSYVSMTVLEIEA